jgi:glycosyltransferase involved in cell wall biosynthesis
MRPQLFVIPAPDAPPSGGNLYNEGLLQALCELSAPSERADWQRGTPAELPARVPAAVVWIDSLYIAQLRQLRAHISPQAQVRLLAHALPSDLAAAAGVADAALAADERALLASFAGALAPSGSMAETLAQRAPGLPCWTIEPAIVRVPPRRTADLSLPRALLVANVTPNKGVLGLLEALAARVRAGDRFHLRCLGRLDVEPAYAADCQAVVARSPLLSTRVAWLGVKTLHEVHDELAQCHVLLSASRSESFGMAVADACASGCVVLARAAGHVCRLVDTTAGGALLSDDAALAEAFLGLCRTPATLRERLAQAARTPLAPRGWHDAAREFLRHDSVQDG